MELKDNKETKETLSELLKRLHSENALPDLESYKEVWMREWADRGVFFCKKNVVWWIIDCGYDANGKITSTSEAKVGKTAPWEEMRTRYGVSREQFQKSFRRIK